MDLFLALAGGSPPFPDGSRLRLHSCFSQAINVSHSGGKLFTFHRYGKGCSPTGWIFHHEDFDEISRFIAADSTLIVKDGSFTGCGYTLRNRRRLNFNVPEGEIALPNLHKFSNPTGLLGPLNEAVNQPDHPIVNLLTHQLDRWLAGQTPDWSALIGLGPGLTPSGDDMLTGALAALYSHPQILALKRCQHMLPDFQSLLQMTTSVSCGYLDSAARGQFSTPLVRLISRLAQSRESESAIRALLGHGHTSGADTLLGLVAGLRWLSKVFPGSHHA
ncbi:DUF2877 domain-containing protein [Enterobacteriaceae bacterium H16N7]|nr:DUF2877 domain-containing protein [Dryocola clanedunensis]